jgi:two-component system KDP operon response regulator KdpE
MVANDLEQRRTLSLCLEEAGYRTQGVESIPSLWQLVGKELPYAILIFALPDSTFAQPWELCRELARYTPALRILLVPENNSRMRTKALHNQADQCFDLPGSPEEILAYLDATRPRHRDLADRSDARRRDEQALAIDLRNRRIYRGHQVIDLTAQECALLKVLAAHEGQVVSHKELHKTLWEYQESQVAHTNLKQYIMRLRRKLEVDPRRPRHLQTVQGLGYRLQVNPVRDHYPVLDAESTNGNKAGKPSPVLG